MTTIAPDLTATGEITTEADLIAAYRRVARRRDIVYGTMPGPIPELGPLWAAYFRRQAAVNAQFAALHERAALILPPSSFASYAANDAATGCRRAAREDEEAAVMCEGGRS